MRLRRQVPSADTLGGPHATGVELDLQRPEGLERLGFLAGRHAGRESLDLGAEDRGVRRLH